MNDRPKLQVLALSPVYFAHKAWAEVSEVADIITTKAANRQEFIAECKAGAFDAVSIIYRHLPAYEITGQLDDEILNLLADLKFVCSCGAGYDKIDVNACTAHNVLVANPPNIVDDATADLAIWLMLGTLRNLTTSILNAKAGKRWKEGGFPLGHNPRGKTLGILGMGGIGRNMAAKARAFGMKIRYHNRTRLESELDNGAEYVSFDKLLAESDALSLNLPLNPSTHHIISGPQLASMKPGIIIINTARGPVIDEAALVDALNSGQVSAVGLDVFENEPEIHPGLMEHPRALLTPHLGTNSFETMTDMEELAIDNILLAVKQGELKTVVIEQRHLMLRN